MIRFLSIFALAFAVVFSGSVVSGKMTGAAAKKAPRAGLCRKMTVAGKVRKWRCRRGHYCCSAPLFGFFGCGTKNGGCFQPN